ncbi:MAG: hypothetical protein V1883_00570 [Candidatus Omnitrophota bacterium]
MREVIEILGILAFLSLVLAVTTGLMIFRFHVKGVKMEWHVWSAVATLVFAVLHVTLIVLY